jgi:hypothetical protein
VSWPPRMLTSTAFSLFSAARWFTSVKYLYFSSVAVYMVDLEPP